MTSSKSLTNLQLELLEIFKLDLQKSQLLEIKSLLANYFAKKTTTEVDKIFEENNWGKEKIEEWANEHMRAKSKIY